MKQSLTRARPTGRPGPAGRSRPTGTGPGAAAILQLQSGAGNRAVATAMSEHAPGSGRSTRSGSGAPPVLQRLAGNPAAPPVRPPGIGPHQDPAFNAMRGRAHGTAKKVKAHPHPKAEAAKAQQASVPPSNDTASQAKAAQVEEMGTAKPGTFDKNQFMAAVRAAIAKAAPKDQKEADEFSSSGKAGAVKGEVMGKVSAGKAASAGDIKGKSEAPPDPSKAVAKPVTPLEPAPPSGQPPDPGAAAAMPKRAPPEQTNLAAAQHDVNSDMAAAGVTEQQLAKSNEPQFQGALAAKQAGDAHTAQAPAAFRAQEGPVVAGAQSGAAGSAKGALLAMVASKGKATSGAGGDKSGAKAADEAARQQVSAQIESMYASTKGETETILKDLDTKVDTAFETGEKEARQLFEDFHTSRVRDWKIQKYLIPVGGLIQWGIDQFKPVSPELLKIFADARTIYTQKMEGVISGVADLIGTELGRARARIAQGRAQIKDFVAKQKGDLRKVAQQAETAIGGKFDELDKSVDDKQQSMVDDLADKYVTAQKEIDERVTALQDENKGLWDQAKDAVAGAIDTIKKLKDMLLGILARAAGAVEKIIADPMAFLGKLVQGVKAGLNQFVGNIVSHLKKGLMGWVLGTLASAGIELPEKFDLKGVFTLVASLVGLSWANFKNRLVKKVGQKTADRLEGAVDFVKAIATGGIGAAWKWIVDKLGNIKDMVLDAIKTFIIEKVVMAGIQWLIGLLNPAAAFVKACKMIYDVIMWFVERAEQIKEFVESILDSTEAILAGAIGTVAGKIEKALANILPLAISFLASLLGLGGLGAKIEKILKSVQKPVNKVFDFLVGKAVKIGKGLLKKLKNSKLGKKAAALKAKAKAAVKKGKAWVKGKVAKAKAWVKGKAAKGKAWVKKKVEQVKGLVLSFMKVPGRRLGDFGSHTFVFKRHGQLMIQSRTLPAHAQITNLLKGVKLKPDQITTEKGLAAQAGKLNGLYATYDKAFDRHKANKQDQGLKAAAKAAETTAKNALNDYISKVETFMASIKGTPGLTIGHPEQLVAQESAGPTSHSSRSGSSNRSHPLTFMHLESEHVIPRSLVEIVLHKYFVGLSFEETKVTDGEYNAMTTVLLYEGAARGKTGQFSTAESQAKEALDPGPSGRRATDANERSSAWDKEQRFPEIAGNRRENTARLWREDYTKRIRAFRSSRLSKTKNAVTADEARNGTKRDTTTARPTPGIITAAVDAQVTTINEMFATRLASWDEMKKRTTASR